MRRLMRRHAEGSPSGRESGPEAGPNPAGASTTPEISTGPPHPPPATPLPWLQPSRAVYPGTYSRFAMDEYDPAPPDADEIAEAFRFKYEDE